MTEGAQTAGEPERRTATRLTVSASAGATRHAASAPPVVEVGIAAEGEAGTAAAGEATGIVAAEEPDTVAVAVAAVGEGMKGWSKRAEG